MIEMLPKWIVRGGIVLLICLAGFFLAIFYFWERSLLICAGLILIIASAVLLLSDIWNKPYWIKLSELNPRIWVASAALLFAGWALTILDSWWPYWWIAWLVGLFLEILNTYAVFGPKRRVASESQATS